MITSAINFAVGTLHTKDYQHFRIDATECGDPEMFEGAALAGRAFPGDIVRWDGCSCQLISRKSRNLFLVGTLDIASKTRYGMTSRGAPIYRFDPYDRSYPPFFVGCSEKDTSRPLLVKIEFTGWEEGATCPRGVLVQTFGPTGNLEAEEAALLAHYGAARWRPRDFKEEDLIVPGRLRGAVPHAALKGPGFGTFHIDPPGCRDIDDAVSLFEVGQGVYQVRIHIADVASWLLANPGLAEKAEEIGQTLYRDGAAVRPMFPLALSEGRFSLVPQEVRGAISIVFEWSEEKGISGPPAWSYDIIRVDGSWTYEAAATAPWASTLASITSSLAGRPVTDPHEWVEQLMLFYNQEAAKLLRTAGKGVLRRHAEPEKERILVALTAGLPVELVAYSSGEYCSAAEEDVAHWGLGAGVYCHASSPIRRWADCLNQLCLMELLFKEGVTGNEPSKKHIEDLQRLAKAAKGYERDLFYVRALLASNTGLEYVATVLGPDQVWIHEWRRRVRADTKDYGVGASVIAQIYHDSSKRNWKGRVVVRIRAST